MKLNSFSFSNEMSQPTQWSAYAKFKKSENHGFGTILKPHIGTKLCRIEFFFIPEWNESTHAMIRPRKIQNIWKSRFWHHFETPYWYQIVQNWILFHFQTKWVSPRNDPPTQNLKKMKIQVLAPFWDSIAAKMKNSDKMTSIDKVPSVFDNQKLSFAHAKNYLY